MTKQTAKEILDDLGVVVTDTSKAKYSPWQQRVIAGFEDIQRFVEENNRLPSKDATDNLFEPIYAIRLERIKSIPKACELLEPFDSQNLILPLRTEGDFSNVDFASILEELGIELTQENDITRLRNVRSTAERKAADMIANRIQCVDFEKFKQVFDVVRLEISNKIRKTRKFQLRSEIEIGRFFILNGQMAYVADKGEEFVQDYGDRDARLRVIYDNGTENNVLMRSLQRALNRDKNARRVTEPITSPLLTNDQQEIAQNTGKIYVLRSNSDIEKIANNRELIHKIGVTKGDVNTRIADAKKQTTYLMADVELVKVYEFEEINTTKLEQKIHKFLRSAQLDLTITVNGKSFHPEEWFLVPLEVIDEVVEAILDHSITKLKYDKNTFSIVNR